ncbi:MAG: D-ribose pyranase [Clostridia bacterium]|nr:D-ribose pyranase [Clostridia bacterium]
MLKSGILNPQLLRVLGESGHMDLLMLSDAAMPLPLEKERVDLAILNDLPRQLTILKAIADQLKLEKIYIAEEIQRVSPNYFAKVKSYLERESIPLEMIPHEQLKAKSRAPELRACIRTGERTSYSTMILQVGVPYGGDDKTDFTI